MLAHADVEHRQAVDPLGAQVAMERVRTIGLYVQGYEALGDVAAPVVKIGRAECLDSVGRPRHAVHRHGTSGVVLMRSDERSEGEECVSTCRSRGSPDE